MKERKKRILINYSNIKRAPRVWCWVKTQTGTLRLLWLTCKEKKMEWNLKLWTLQRERKRQTARERKKMKLAFSSGPSLDDQSLLLEPLTFFLEEHFALPHKSLSKHTTPPPTTPHPPPPPPPLCWWRTVGVSNIVTVWTNNLNISDVRHRYENTHIKAYLCVCESNTSRCFHTHFTARPSSTFSTDWIYVLSIELSVSGLIKTICFLPFFHLNCIKIKQLA